MSPRSGTPVKLLGREDASVDWYNLEKSKRVKAFRCGTPGGGNGSIGNQESHEGHQKLESSIENQGNIMPVSMDKEGASTELRLEYDNLEVSPQRRGLLDHGLRKPLTRLTRPSFPAPNGLQKTQVEYHAFDLSGNGPILGRSNNADSTTPTNNRKRTLEVPLEEST
ncbi:hypothetical protein AKJ16_DCAP25832 [Drosera capensis]